MLVAIRAPPPDAGPGDVVAARLSLRIIPVPDPLARKGIPDHDGNMVWNRAVVAVLRLEPFTPLQSRNQVLVIAPH